MTQESFENQYESFKKLVEQLSVFKNSTRLFNKLYENSLDNILKYGKNNIIIKYFPPWKRQFKAEGHYRNLTEDNKELELDYIFLTDKKGGKSKLEIRMRKEPYFLQLLKKHDFRNTKSYLENKDFDKKIR